LTSSNSTPFDSTEFLASAGLGRTIVELMPKETFFNQGDSADSVFYLQKGRAKLTVVSQNGKEATITLLSAGDLSVKSLSPRSLGFIWPPPLP
jgi:CRP/FNR family transcriptional regulator, cyclic AMP receptor protein